MQYYKRMKSLPPNLTKRDRNSQEILPQKMQVPSPPQPGAGDWWENTSYGKGSSLGKPYPAEERLPGTVQAEEEAQA